MARKLRKKIKLRRNIEEHSLQAPPRSSLPMTLPTGPEAGKIIIIGKDKRGSL